MIAQPRNTDAPVRIRVLQVTNAYPYARVPEYGVFVQEQIASLDGLVDTSGVVFINGRENGKRAYLNAIRDIRRLSVGADVIHCHHLYSLFSASLAFTGKPLILSFLNDWLHELDGVPSQWFRKVACWLGVILSTCVIFKSPVPADLRKRPRVFHLPNGVDQRRFAVEPRAAARRRLGLAEDLSYVLFVSSKDQYRAQKRYDLFAKVMLEVELLSMSTPAKELILVGEARGRVPDFFNSANLHLLTSDFEGSPNSVKESLCCGVPVVSRDVGNVSEMVGGLSGCVVMDSSDPKAIAETVVRVLAQTESVDRHSLREEFLGRGLTNERVAARLRDIYQIAAGRAN